MFTKVQQFSFSLFFLLRYSILSNALKIDVIISYILANLLFKYHIYVTEKPPLLSPIVSDKNLKLQ